MNYQLVIQFPESLCGDIDWIAEMEDRLEEALSNAEVDGHDLGGGEVNIFIFTDAPKETFNEVKEILESSDYLLDQTKVAYRAINEDQYTCLWPEGLTEFEVT